MNINQLTVKRLSARITQGEIAKAMNTHRTYISHVETGLRELTPDFEKRYLQAIESIKQSKTEKK